MLRKEERTGTWHAYIKPMLSPKARSRPNYNAFCDLQKLGFLKTIPFDGISRFAGYIAVHFPDVAASIDEADFGVLHLEVGEFKLATRDAILWRDWETVRTHFAFIDKVLETADIDLHNAIGISYLGNLFYNETSLNFAKARTLLPKRLAVALEIIERHYEELEH